MKKWILGMTPLLLAFQASACELPPSSLPGGFVYVDEVDPTIMQEIEFATANNLVGIPLKGYETGRAICTKVVADVLHQIQKKLKKKGLSLCILDAYRPQRAVEHIKHWAKDLTDQKTKARFYPNIEKREILGAFVAAKRSSHSRGSTVDILIADAHTKERLDFGPDGFGESDTYLSTLTPIQQKNRLFLREIMMAHGFKPYDKEFWHFTFRQEPFPKTYFDFPIR